MDRPKDLPNRLECAYCQRSNKHGGECRGKDINRYETGCLYFNMDSKGCIRNADLKIPFSLYSEIPPLGMWSDKWTLYDNETEIRLNKIYSISWEKTKGYLYVHANCDYYINEFCEGYKPEKNKPNLKVIK
ncbi:hypothetical protein [Clostridium sp.]|uniref:hypothetical protein n=1 Tax=Clostridium sp. TaxID=1506 RepID=UPI00283E2012|nr:hypothetical protein [Clostridium sp.]MDR3598420.1 hypothetical protein [Clostridium sp.]